VDLFIDKSDLLKELHFVRSAVEKRNTIPILSHLLLDAEGCELKISGTDLEVGARTACPAKVKTKGTAVIPALRFLDIVRSAPDGEIHCRALDGDRVEATFQHSSFKIVGLPKRDFPTFPGIPEPVAKIQASLLAECINKTSFAISAEESRYILNAALLKLNAGSLSMVATDGHRLALVEREHEAAVLAEEITIMIPRKVLGLLGRLASEGDEKASIAISKDESHLFFVLGSRVLTSRVLMGQFPNYESVLLKEDGKAVELDRDAFEETVRRVALLADDRLHGIRLALETNRLEISASSPEYGEAKEAVEVRYAQEGVQIGFNAEYLLEFLCAVRAIPSIRMNVKNAESAAQFQPTGSDAHHYRYVLMPLRL
jgi:DNA polymerase III subunit beta